MLKFGKAVVKYRIPILIVCILLIIPSVIGMMSVRINYDMLDYLPSDIETVKGQDILMDQFGEGAFSLVIVKGMDEKSIVTLEKKIETVDHVKSVVWYDDFADSSIPMELLPEKYYDAFNSGDATLMAVFFDTTTSEDATMDAIQEIKSIAGEQCLVSGMSALVTDLREMCEKEEPIYVAIAVVLVGAVVMLFMDSWLVPFIFLASIGMAILYNFGSNIFLGDVSYITKALCAVLQLAVTMDFSIFLWYGYCEEKQKTADHHEAMAKAIENTLRSVVGSSMTAAAGFLALCFMSYTLGFNLGIVMAKGVVLGVICSFTMLPSLILLLDKPLEKTMHRSLMPKMDKLARFVVKRYWIFLVIFAVVVIPAFYGYMNTNKYYDLSQSLPKDLDFMIANTALQEDFGIATTHMALIDADLSQKDTAKLIEEINKVDGVTTTLGLDSVLGSDVPEDMIPDSIRSLLESDEYKLLLINSEYNVASDKVNSQIDKINDILKTYDKNAMLIGEASCTKDMISITDHDFDVVNAISIVVIFIIIAIVLKSVSLPVILVAVIELAIFINLGIPYYTNVSLPFISPVCISTIQLGATVDYAILMTNRYIKERSLGHAKLEAGKTALSSTIPSVVVSACALFAATIGVALYSNIDMISSMCELMARGAIISMLSVIFVLPAMFMLLDKVICKTTWLYSVNKLTVKSLANQEVNH